MVKHLVFVLALLCARTAAADIGVVVAGEPTMQPQLVRQLEGWIKKRGMPLVAVALPSDAINTLTDCFVIEDESCARGVIEKRGRARSIIFAKVEVQSGGDIEKTITVTAYWFENGQKTASARRFCERCNEATLRTTADDLMEQLIKSAPQATGKLKLTTSPAGATCAIDGKPVGPTPLDHDVTEGTHEITVSREHHRSETRSVAIKAGETTTLDVALLELPHSPKSRLLPLVTMGAGAALLVTGVVMFAIDEDKGRDQPEFIRNSAPAGVAIGAAGVVALGVGYVWYRMTGKTESQPVATVHGGTTYLGWQGRF